MPNPWTFHGLTIYVIGLGFVFWSLGMALGYIGKWLGM